MRHPHSYNKITNLCCYDKVSQLLSYHHDYRQNGVFFVARNKPDGFLLCAFSAFNLFGAYPAFLVGPLFTRSNRKGSLSSPIPREQSRLERESPERSWRLSPRKMGLQHVHHDWNASTMPMKVSMRSELPKTIKKPVIWSSVICLDIVVVL